MKAHAEMIQGLTSIAQSLGTILQQLRIHRNMVEFWGYPKFATELSRQRSTLSELLDSVLKRLLALEQSIDLQHLGRLNIGQTVEEILVSEREMTEACYALANRVGASGFSDIATRKIVEAVAMASATRMEYFDQQLELVRQLGAPSYLATRC